MLFQNCSTLGFHKAKPTVPHRTTILGQTAHSTIRLQTLSALSVHKQVEEFGPFYYCPFSYYTEYNITLGFIKKVFFPT